MLCKRLFLWVTLATIGLPGLSQALVIEIQGKRSEPEMLGASCVDIAGEYPGVRIEPSDSSKLPRICYNAAKVDSISIVNAVFVATAPAKLEIVVRFEHQFPTGINGKVMARAKMQGFFSTTNGQGVPSGDKVSFKGIFSQSGKDDTIAEPFTLQVGDELDTAIFDYSAKEPYLIAGPRTLKGELKFAFKDGGHKLAIPDRALISIDTGSTFEDKLETLEPLDEEGATEEPSADTSGGAQKSGEPLPVPGSPTPANPVERLKEPKSAPKDKATEPPIMLP